MSGSTRGTPTLCRRCGQIGAGASGNCAHCGARRGGTVRYAAARPRVVGPVHRLEPAAVAKGPRLNRKVGAGVAAAVLAVVALVVIWPDPPSPAGVVEEYFDRLGDGDTEAALALVTAGSDGSPLLTPAVLADEADRPDDVEVTADESASLYTTVTAAYTLGGQQVEQRLAVVETGDDENPYRIEQALLWLTVTLPNGLDISVNGVPVEPVAATRGLPVLPGRYRATTSGNQLFAGATREATYSSGSRMAAEIDLTGLDLASTAQGAVQQAVQSYLDANCVNPSYGSRCPVEAPSMSWSQNTSWTFEAYPQVEVSRGDGPAQVAFTTTTPGSANYTITYSDFGGSEQTQTGAVPIDVSGNAGIGDDGTIAVALGY